MMPTFNDGDLVNFDKYTNQDVKIDDIVVFMHPLKDDFKLIKRVKKIRDKSKFFVEGDNLNIGASSDSHNFGYINKNNLIAIKRT
tara:strand:- start:441 stop:695 length:255 start_codon:yes stop_codon:yes gene_type:complete